MTWQPSSIIPAIGLEAVYGYLGQPPVCRAPIVAFLVERANGHAAYRPLRSEGDTLVLAAQYPPDGVDAPLLEIEAAP